MGGSHGVQGGSGGLRPPVYKCTAYKGDTGGKAPRFTSARHARGVRGLAPV